MTDFDESLTSLMALVVENCDEISSYIQTTNFIAAEHGGMSGLHGHNSSQPFEYLKDCHTRSWDDCFAQIMDLWDKDRISAIRMNNLIERLSAPAAELDVLVPKLDRECRKCRNMPQSVIRNAKKMQTCINSCLNSLDHGLEYWRLIRHGRLLKKPDVVPKGDIRQRRPIVGQDTPDEAESDSDVKSEQNQQHSEEEDGSGQTSLRRCLSFLSRTFTSDLALLSLTGIVSTIACIIQSLAFFNSTDRRGKSGGSVDDPDFYNALQNLLMQTLALYTVLTPAFRASGTRYAFWVWILAVLSLGAGLASLAVFAFFMTLTPLLACVSAVLQAFVTLALVLSLPHAPQSSRQPEIKKTV